MLSPDSSERFSKAKMISVLAALRKDLFEIVEFILADQAFGQFGGLCFLASAQLHACHERDGCVV